MQNSGIMTSKETLGILPEYRKIEWE